MNWYKYIKLAQQTRDLQYTDIGHYGENDNYQIEPNYMWIYHGGNIIIEEETGDEPIHHNAFPNIDLEKIYSGRFETDTGRLSIIKPLKGTYIFKEIPSLLIRKLYKKFPIKEIHEF